jgi:hypothetical protein
MKHPVAGTTILEASGKPLDRPDRPVRGAQQQHPRV